jgi:branched-chain amino acid transport system substrate-binding protein
MRRVAARRGLRVAVAGMATLLASTIIPIVSTGTASAAQASGTPWNLGSIADLTGANSTTSGLICQGAMQAWESWTNANGGINGHPVHVNIQDEQSSLSGSIQAAQNLVAANVVADVGNCVGFGSSIANVVTPAGLPVIGGAVGTAGAPYGVNPYFFAAGTEGPSELYTVLDGAKKLGVKSLGNMYCTESPLCALAAQNEQTSAQALGMQEQIVAISSSAPSYAAQCLTFKNAGLQALHVTAPSTAVTQVIQQCNQQGWNPRIIGVSVDVRKSWLTNPAYKNFLAGTASFQWFGNSQAAKTFTKAMNKYDPSGLDAPAIASKTWASGQLFATIAKEGKLTPSSTKADVYKWVQTLSNNQNGGYSPPLTFTAGNRSVPCDTIVSGNGNGKYTAPLGSKFICAPASVANSGGAGASTTSTTS